MLSTLRSAVQKNGIPVGRIVTGATAILIAASLVGPALTARQQSERSTRELSDSTGLHREQLSIYDRIVRNRLETEAKQTLATARAAVAANATKADASATTTAIAGLDVYTKLDDRRLRSSIDSAMAAATALAAAGAEADRAAAAAAAANTPDGAKSTARHIASARYGWGADQFQCVSNLWQKESNWNYRASNGSSGATGIPQALPGSKMASFGADWATNATTQVKWGLDYIARSYGTPCSAWSHSQSVNWY